MNTNGTSTWIPTGQKGLYAFERYNIDKKSSNPWLKVIYNAYWGEANRNKDNNNTNTGYILSSRCVLAYWYSAYFLYRCVSNNGKITIGYVFGSNTGTHSTCSGLRPVLQVERQ